MSLILAAAMVAGKLDEGEGVKWLQGHLDYVSAPLLGEPWILAADVTVKALYGHWAEYVADLGKALRLGRSFAKMGTQKKQD